jgi:hypothetical protein
MSAQSTFFDTLSRDFQISIQRPSGNAQIQPRDDVGGLSSGICEEFAKDIDFDSAFVFMDEDPFADFFENRVENTDSQPKPSGPSILYHNLTC